MTTHLRPTLAETAVAVAGGGALTSLAPARRDQHVWRATVTSRGGIVHEVTLDLPLRIATVHAVQAGARPQRRAA